MSVQAPNGVVDVAVADEAEAVRVGRAVPLLLPGPARATGPAPTSGCCAARSRRTGCASTTCARCIEHAGRHRLGARAAARVRRRHGDRACRASRAGRSASSPTTRRTSAARSTATAPTRPRASCSSATPSTCRVLFLCDTPGIMVGPEAEKTALVRHCCRLFVIGANLTVPFFTDRAAQGLRARRAGDGRRQLPGAVLHGRVADRASSAAWGSRAR